MRTITLFLVLFQSSVIILAQGVGIKEDGSQPDSTAILDLQSTDKGFLPPRLTFEQVINIPDPAYGLVVYMEGELIHFDGTRWVRMNGEHLMITGAYSQGGKIFYHIPDVGSYIISDELDLSLEWGCYGTDLDIPNTGEFIGEENTAAIVEGCPETDIAAAYCQTLSYNGYSDWYLPSRAELTTAIINLPDDGWDGFYWSSTEFNGNFAYKVNTIGSPFFSAKNSSASVRCARYTAGPNCLPESPPAHAGDDIVNWPGTSYTLNGSDHGTGIGLWSIQSGAGGIVEDPADRSSMFTGVSGSTYVLLWQIVDSCGISSDEVSIGFVCDVDLADAGGDQLNIPGTSCTLNANFPYSGIGEWGGSDGQIESQSSPSSTFYGTPGNSYTLTWLITNDCGQTADQVQISFVDDCDGPTVANAGPDINTTNSRILLEGNVPISGTGHWSIWNYNFAGSFSNSNNPSTYFYPNPDYPLGPYYVRWTITDCNGNSSEDDAIVTFFCIPSPNYISADYEDPNTEDLCVVVTGTGLDDPDFTGDWSVIIGDGGTFNNSESSTTTFCGLPGEIYLLRWTVYGCRTIYTQMVVPIQCAGPPTTADAGPDQLNVLGTSTGLQGNIPIFGDGQWSIFGGQFGVFSDETNPFSTFTGWPGNSYTLRWTITDCDQTSIDDVVISFDCTPVTANAGPDQMNAPGITTNLQANTPPAGTFAWSIISGAGGDISSESNPGSAFSGLSGVTYTLRWTVTTDCETVYDDVIIQFECQPQPTTADAGPNQNNIIPLTTTLQGNVPETGTGSWNIISGTGGVVADSLNPTSSFSGIEGDSYTLRWSIVACSVSYDDVVISFGCPTANAGPDQINAPGMSTTLQADIPFAGTGTWTIQSGTGGMFGNPNDPHSSFTGDPGCIGYVLRWTVTSSCITTYDDMEINFECNATIADAGADQGNVSGVIATLQGNEPQFGTGLWTLVSGNNGVIDEPNNPNSLFVGVNGNSFELKWTITDTCCITEDIVQISFSPFGCGMTFQDTRDHNVYGTLQISGTCWMSSNLNYAGGSSECYPGDPDNCDDYGRLYDWNSADDGCPNGWQLPTDAQWCTLAQTQDPTVSCSAEGPTGTDAGGRLKETGTTYWDPPNTGATNSSGFSARGGGSTTIPHNLGEWGSFWTSTSNGSQKWSWEMFYNDARVYRNDYSNSNKLSVRCKKN